MSEPMPRKASAKYRHELEIAQAVQAAIPGSQVMEALSGRVTIRLDCNGFVLNVGVIQVTGARSVWATLVFESKDRPNTLWGYESHAKEALRMAALGRTGESAARAVLRTIYGPRAVIG